MSTPTFKGRLRDVNLIFASVLVCSRIRVACGTYFRDFLGAEQPSSVLVCFRRYFGLDKQAKMRFPGYSNGVIGSGKLTPTLTVTYHSGRF
jgi:hypothetical protein